MNTTRRQHGFGHIGLILAVVLLLLVGLGGWYVWSKSKDKTAEDSTSLIDASVAEAIKNARCEYNDKDLCKFFTGWKAQKYATITSRSTGGGEESSTVMKTEGTDKSHIKVTSPSMTYELITIGKTTYTKASNGTWWKQTTPDTATEALKDDTKVDLEEPASGDTAEPDKTTYKQLGKEKCGNLTCFKYQVTDPGDKETRSYFWFDDKEYQMRRTLTETADSTFDATYDYAKVSISEPSPVKDLQPGQYLVPGQDEPVTLPSSLSPEALQGQ